MISKTLDQWLDETEKYGTLYYLKYAESWSNNQYSSEVRKHYHNVSNQYAGLRTLLIHIKTYGMPHNMIIDKERCVACRSNQNHIDDLIKNYRKYQKWIDQIVKQQR